MEYKRRRSAAIFSIDDGQTLLENKIAENLI